MSSLVRTMLRLLPKGVYWLVLAVVLGLAQLWANMCRASGSDVRAFSIAMENGVLLFFTMGLTISVTLDYHFDSDIDTIAKIGKLWRATAFTFFPLIITLLVILTYSAIQFRQEAMKETWVVLAHWLSLGMSCVLALVGKTYLFCKDRMRTP